MKKLLLILAVLAAPALLFAEPNLRNVATAKDDSASSGKTITANITYKTGSRVMVWAIVGRSDKSTSEVKIQRANSAGSTAAYTTVARVACGSGQVSYIGNPVPVFIGEVGYAYRFLLDSTTANSLIVNYTYE